MPRRRIQPAIAFALDPLVYVTDEERDRAVLCLSAYFERFTGSFFEEFADDDPYKITASDLAAVSMLGVNVPPNTAAWLLGDGQETVSVLLRDIPPWQPIWARDADLTPDGPAWRLWDSLETGHWREGTGKTGMGPTTTSKLLAAKRPHLIPIQDSVVTTALLGPGARGYRWWALWRQHLSGAAGEELQAAATSLADDVPEARRLSVLRLLDVAVWMRERGYVDVPGLRKAFAGVPLPSQAAR